MQKFTKNVLKGVKNNFGRFLAIMAIVALGVGFLIGIMQATPDMKNTMSRYYIDNAAYDVDVKGIYGLSREDVRAIEAAEEVDSRTHGGDRFLFADKMCDARFYHIGIPIIVQ